MGRRLGWASRMIVTEETARRIADALERLEKALPQIDYRGSWNVDPARCRACGLPHLPTPCLPPGYAKGGL